MKKYLTPLVCSVLLLGACAKTPPPAADATQAEAFRHRYETRAQAYTASQAARYQGSIRFGEEGNTRRVTTLIWGDPSSSLRMDITAGVGATLAKAFEDKNTFMVYVLRENKVYTHKGARKPTLRLGAPLPLTLTDILTLLNGDYQHLFRLSPQPARTGQKGTMRYHLADGKLPGTVDINADGLPVRWESAAQQGWSMTITPNEAGLPTRLELEHPQGKRLILLVKSREFLQSPFTSKQLTLTLPEGTREQPITDKTLAQSVPSL